MDSWTYTLYQFLEHSVLTKWSLGVDMNMIFGKKSTALVHAINGDQERIVRLLLEAGTNLCWLAWLAQYLQSKINANIANLKIAQSTSIASEID